jgi:glycosyltransferase involved in cell wall biosynthesis
MNQLVSVITPFYESERFLAEAIDSVALQSYADWELILVDDGSADRSTQIAFKYQEAHPGKIRYLQHSDRQNHGASAARNLALHNARGEYIAFLDSDDVLFPNQIAEQVAALKEFKDAAMVCGKTLYWYSWTGTPGDQRRDFVHDLGRYITPGVVVPPPKLLAPALRGEVHMPCDCSILVRAEAIARTGGYEDQFRGAYGDQVFYSKLFLNEPVVMVSNCWGKYRINPNSMGRMVEKQGLGEVRRLEFLRWLRGYLKERGLAETEMGECVKGQICSLESPFIYKALRSVGMFRSAEYNPRLASARCAWASTGTGQIEVRINSLNGPVFARGGPWGEARTGQWVQDGTMFILRDASAAGAPERRDTLATARVRISHAGISVRTGVLSAKVSEQENKNDQGTVRVNLEWRCKAVSNVEVRLDTPEGGLIASGGPEGNAEALLAFDREQYIYLNDFSDNDSPSCENVLSCVRLQVRDGTALVRSGSLTVHVDECLKG